MTTRRPRRRIPLDIPPPFKDTSPMPAPAAPSPPANCGRMVVTLTPNGTSRPHPTVEFDPVGMFTPGLLNDHLVHFAQEVERAQAKVRHEQAQAARSTK